ncbi:MAG: glucose-6-phosphate dehydrogenase assembly protein OpcA [Geodermatophilaceae bacterium]|nr:glucose-6-phosphate dehydrogenase assembly protein OpcA [Geodermatophilaceae bacterium]
MTTLWDTTGTAVVKALAAERRAGGAVMSGLALTLVVVVEEKQVGEAEEAARIAASVVPCRMLMVVRRQVDAPVPRLDAEVLIGGRLGPGESIVMRMYGRLALHAESVVLPLLAPDAPVVTWWHGPPPDVIAHDPLGIVADRRITECSYLPDPAGALEIRAADYLPGDTDLAWTRTTGWRAALAAALDSVEGTVTGGTVEGDPGTPSRLLLAGWLSARLGCHIALESAVDAKGGTAISGARLELDTGRVIDLKRADPRSVSVKGGAGPDTVIQLPKRSLGDLLGEELRRLDDDQLYGEALATTTGTSGLTERSGGRRHVWQDPAEQAAAPT